MNNSFVESYVYDSNGLPVKGVVGALNDSDENLIGKGISDSEGYLLVDFESEEYGANLNLYLNKAQFKQHEIVLKYIEDLGNSMDVDVSLDIISNIENTIPQK